MIKLPNSSGKSAFRRIWLPFLVIVVLAFFGFYIGPEIIDPWLGR